MNRNHSLVILFVLVIALMFPVFMVPTATTDSNTQSDDIQQALLDVDVPDTIPNADVDLSMMFFTETLSSEDGLFYVCRRGMGSIAYFGASSVMYLAGDTVFTLEFPGSNEVIPEAENPTGSVTNYLLGNDQSQWNTGIRDFAILRYSEIYPGIDLVYKLHDGNLKYEFVVSPYADPDAIRLDYVDVDTIEITDDALIVTKDGQQMADTALKVFQNAGAIDVGCTFSLDERNSIVFNLGTYDRSDVLVIDPIIMAYSTYLGGSSTDAAYSISVENGYAYIVGRTESSGFPILNAYDSNLGSTRDCFVVKLAPNGSLIFSSFLGGTNQETAYGIAVESSYAFITGVTFSTDFPTTLNAFNSTHSGAEDCFVVKLAADGQSLIYSTFLGGSANDLGNDIAVENSFAYVTGETDSIDYPTVNAFNSTNSGGIDVFVTKLATDGQSLIYSTYIGGTTSDYGCSIAVEDAFAYIGGRTASTGFPTFNAYDSSINGGYDCFVTKLSTDGQSLNFSTFLGDTQHDYGQGIAVDNGNVYLTGNTGSTYFPVVNAYDSSHNSPGFTDGFVTKFNATGNGLVYSTFLGGDTSDYPESIAVENGFAFVMGRTASSDFPVTSNAYDTTISEMYDCFVTKFTNDGKFLAYSTFIGGDNFEYGMDISVENGSAYFTGYSASSDFPMFNAYDASHNGGHDCFVAKFEAEDSDMDGLSDGLEYVHGTNPYCVDTDNDNFLDGYEVEYGSDPLDPLSYPTMPQAWYNAIYEDLDGNATLIQNLLTWSDGNSTLLQTIMQQLDDNATLLIQVISWLDGNHTSIEALFTYMDGNATMLQVVIQQLNDNATLLTQVASWLDGNHTAIETLFTYMDGNATLLLSTVNALNGNSSLIENLLTWSAGNATLLLNVIDQVNAIEPADLTQVIAWLDGNHTAIETLFTYMEGNVTLLLSIVESVGVNSAELDMLILLINKNTYDLNLMNVSCNENLDAIRDILDQLGVVVGDSDYDGLDDLDELLYGTDLLCMDTDCDNLNDAFEIKIGTDPLDDDSDGDTYLDGIEILAGTDPLNSLDYPGIETSTTPDDSSSLILVVIIGSGAGVVGIVIMLVFMKKRRASS
ncbi:MAG: DUF7948 domain-containing protein [Candidatus Thorarchaeota archaeon]